MALGQSMDLPMQAVCRALTGGAAGSWAREHRAEGRLKAEFPLGFKLALHHKDLAIALAEAQRQGLELPLTQQVAAMEQRLIASGYGDQDVSVLMRWFASG